MKSTHFDQYAEDYDTILSRQLNFFDAATDYFAEYKTRIVKERARTRPEAVLEYGCGTGRNIPFLHQIFPASKVFGCDISEKSLELASKKNTAAEFFHIENAGAFFEKFDLVFISCVFHHIPPPDRKKTMSDIGNMLRRGGELFIFEHNPYNPVTRYLVNTCPFDKDAVLIPPRDTKTLLVSAGFTTLKIRYALFFPSILKKMRFLEKRLAIFPLGGQYYIQALRS